MFICGKKQRVLALVLSLWLKSLKCSFDSHHTFFSQEVSNFEFLKKTGNLFFYFKIVQFQLNLQPMFQYFFGIILGIKLARLSRSFMTVLVYYLRSKLELTLPHYQARPLVIGYHHFWGISQLVFISFLRENVLAFLVNNCCYSASVPLPLVSFTLPANLVLDRS